MSANRAAIWPVFRYRDAKSAIRFLVDVFGFDETAVYTDDADPENVVHAELRWPGGGGVMLASVGAGGEPFSSLEGGAASTYVVTDEPDALFERAAGAGMEVVRGLRDEDYGSRGFTVRDPEGHYWSFGTYAGS